MCDPVSIGLTVAGSALQGIAQQQSASSANKLDAQAVSNERARQKGLRTNDLATQKSLDDQNYGTVGDTLATYSRPNQDQMQADQTAQLTSGYTSPIDATNFAAPLSVKDSAVQKAVDKSAALRKGQSLQQAGAKAKLDASGNVNLASSITAANNLAGIRKNIMFKDDATRDYQTASQDSQSVLPLEENAARLKGQQAGAGLGMVGDLLSLGGTLYGLGGSSLFGDAANGGLGKVAQFGARNGIPGLAGGASYISPMAGVANSGVYARALPAIF